MSRKISNLVILFMLVFLLPTSFVHGQEDLPAPGNLWFHNDTLHWDAVEGASNYVVERRRSRTVYDQN